MKKEILRLEHIDKVFGRYRIFNDFHLNLYEGEIVSLIGLSGCGKEELVDILSGMDTPDSGRFIFNEVNYSLKQPIASEQIGIMTLSLRGGLIPQMTIAENIFVICKHSSTPVIYHKKTTQKQASAVLNEFGINTINPATPARRLSEVEQQAIQLIKAYVKNMKLVVVDNIAGTYMQSEFQMLIRIMALLKENGISILWLSNSPDLVSDMADRTVVMKSGENIRTIYHDEYRRKTVSDILLKHESVKYDTNTLTPPAQRSVAFQAVRLCASHIRDLTFSVHTGEILGIFDLDSRSLSELEKIIIGQLQPDSGALRLCGKPFTPGCLEDAVRHSIGYIRGTDMDQSIFRNLSILNNILLPILKRTSQFRILVNPKIGKYVKKECQTIEEFLQRNVDMTPSAADSALKQQIVYNRWLLYSPKVLLCMEPFARTDILGKRQLRGFYKDFSRNDTGVLILSVNIADLSCFCDRILLLKNGVPAAEYLKINFDKIDLTCL